MVHAFRVDRSDEVGKEGQGHAEVVDAWHRRMARVAVVNAKQLPARGKGAPFRAQVIALGDGKAPPLVAGLGIVNGQGLGDVPPLRTFQAKQKPAALIRKRPFRIRPHRIPRARLEVQSRFHDSRAKVWWYLLASSANTVTTTPRSSRSATATAPATFAAADGDSSSPATFAARRIMA